MFMKPEERGDPPSDAVTEEPALAGHVSEPDAVEDAAPSTRGWTMFTKDEADPEAEEPPAEAAAPVADEGSPSTRGWTMFTKDEDDPASNPEPTPEPDPAPAPEPAAADPAEAGAAPNSRGWTMFMEPGAAAAPDAPVAPDAPAAPDAEAPGDETAEPGASKKRGWTMFMNAPLEDLPSKEEGPAGAPPALVSNVEAADKEGWTVFGAPALKRPEVDDPWAAKAEPALKPTREAEAEAEAEAPSRGQTIIVSKPAPVAALETPTEDAPSAARANAPTLVNTGVPAGTPIEREKTIVVTSAPADKPNMMYFKKGEVEPEGGISPRGPTVRDVVSTSRPVEERVSRTSDPSAALPVVGEPTDLEPVKNSNTELYAIGGAVAVVAAVAAYFAFFS